MLNTRISVIYVVPTFSAPKNYAYFKSFFEIFKCFNFREGSVISDIQVLYPDVSDEVRKEKCSSFQDLKTNQNFSPELNVQELTVKTLGKYNGK